jgi:hypothetical protein
MTDSEKHQDEGLEPEELEEQEGELLPDREAMSILNHPVGPPTIEPLPPAE